MAILTNPNDLPVPKADAVMSTVDADNLRQRCAAVDAVLRDFVKVLAGIAVAALAAMITALGVAG